MSFNSADVKPVIIGRSSSHFTRVTRMFAAEFGVEYSFEVVRELLSLNPEHYAGNPALKMPALRTEAGTWYGALNICRELSRRATVPKHVVWPEELEGCLLSNACELTLQAMSTSVNLVMSKAAAVDPASSHQVKMRASLVNSLVWLDENMAEIERALPARRDVSFLEVCLFCFVSFLDFREVLSTQAYSGLEGFRRTFGARPSAATTPFKFDT